MRKRYHWNIHVVAVRHFMSGTSF